LLSRHHLIGLFLVICGVTLLGLGTSSSVNSSMLGFVLCIISNFITAIQIVV